MEKSSPKNYWFKIILVKKWKNNLVKKKNLIKKIVVKKKIGQQNVGPKKFLGLNNFARKKNVFFLGKLRSLKTLRCQKAKNKGQRPI